MEIIAEPERKNPTRNPEMVVSTAAKSPRARTWPATTQIPAASGSSNLTRSLYAFNLFIMLTIIC